MNKSFVHVYKKDVSIIKVKEDDIKVSTTEGLPCLCFFNGNDKLIGVANEYIKDEQAYLVDISKDKIFSSGVFIENELPTKTGALLYITKTGQLTGKKDGNTLIGIFLSVEGGAVLFKLN